MSGAAVENPDALVVQGLSAGYGKITVVKDMTFRVPKGSVVALLGPNGAGKTTLLKTIAGLIKPSEGRILAGGLDVTGARPSRVSRAGVCLIPEGRGIFRSLTVKENLLLHIPPWRKSVSADKALEVFPILKEKLNTNAGNLSGGQQQMLAMGRAYLCEPKIVLLDEVSMGLAPIVLDEVFDSIRELGPPGSDASLGRAIREPSAGDGRQGLSHEPRRLDFRGRSRRSRRIDHRTGVLGIAGRQADEWGWHSDTLMMTWRLR